MTQFRRFIGLWVAAVALIVGIYLCGLLATLIGPAEGRVLGPVAFGCTLCLFVFLRLRRPKDGRMQFDSPLLEFDASLDVWRGRLMVPIVFCLVVFCASFFVTAVASGGDGVAAGSDPVFAQRETYLLNDHGHFTAVARSRYLTVGTGFTIGWHVFGIGFALGLLQVALFQVQEEIELIRYHNAGNEPPK